MREDIWDIIRNFCKWKDVAILERKVMSSHIHLMLSILPQYSVSCFNGISGWKSAMTSFEQHANLKCKYSSRHFWATGCFVSKVERKVINPQWPEHSEDHRLRGAHRTMPFESYFKPPLSRAVLTFVGFSIEFGQIIEYNSKTVAVSWEVFPGKTDAVGQFAILL